VKPYNRQIIVVKRAPGRAGQMEISEKWNMQEMVVQALHGTAMKLASWPVYLNKNLGCVW
jgi:hypothetical protein